MASTGGMHVRCATRDCRNKVSSGPRVDALQGCVQQTDGDRVEGGSEAITEDHR